MNSDKSATSLSQKSGLARGGSGIPIYPKKSTQHTVFTRISATPDSASPSNKRRIWDKKVHKRRPRISAAAPMRRLFEKLSITKKPLQSNSNTALEIHFHQKRCSSVQSDYISPLAVQLSSLSKKRRMVTIKRRFC